jgi:hypothetical protein
MKERMLQNVTHGVGLEWSPHDRLLGIQQCILRLLLIKYYYFKGNRFPRSLALPIVIAALEKLN